MIPGVLASMRRRGGGSPGPAALFSANFLTGVYTVDGVGVTAADIIDKPLQISTAGLEILDIQSTATVAIINDALTTLLADDLTIVVEYYERGDSGDSIPIILQGTDPADAMQVLRVSSNSFMNIAETSGAGFRQATDSHVFAKGVHKCAINRSNGTLSMSVDGRSVVTTSADTFASPATTASLGHPRGAGYVTHDIYIRTIDVYSLQSDAALPTLSVQPTFSLPGSRLAEADFIAGVYKVDGSAVTLASIVDQPGANTAFGLELPYGDVPINITGGLLTKLLLMDWTVLLDYEEDNFDDTTTILAVTTNAVDEGVTLTRLAYADDLNMEFRDFNAVPASRTATDPHFTYSETSIRIAMTRVNGRLSMSKDGNPVVTVGTSLTATAEAAAFGAVPGGTTVNGGFIRAIYVWAPMADSALQALSST